MRVLAHRLGRCARRVCQKKHGLGLDAPSFRRVFIAMSMISIIVILRTVLVLIIMIIIVIADIAIHVCVFFVS